MSLPKAKLYATPAEVQKAWEVWSKFRKCARCNQSFTWLGSFGAWECNQHLGDVTCRVIQTKDGIFKRDYRYWDCCKERPFSRNYNRQEKVWNNFRSTRYIDQWEGDVKVPGCVPCDHTESTQLLDDGIRLNKPLISDKYSFAPLNGHGINDTVIYNGEHKIILQVYYDKSVDVQDVDISKIMPKHLEWPDIENHIKIGEYYNWNFGSLPTPIQIKNIHMDYDSAGKPVYSVDFLIKDLGMAVHDIAALIPFMGSAPELRPGWNFDKRDGKVMFPHIKNCSSRAPYNK